MYEMDALIIENDGLSRLPTFFGIHREPVLIVHLRTRSKPNDICRCIEPVLEPLRSRETTTNPLLLPNAHPLDTRTIPARYSVFEAVDESAKSDPVAFLFPTHFPEAETLSKISPIPKGSLLHSFEFLPSVPLIAAS